MLAHLTRRGQTANRTTMADESKCPMGRHAWLATFLVVAFVLLFFSKKLGLL